MRPCVWSGPALCVCNRHCGVTQLLPAANLSRSTQSPQLIISIYSSAFRLPCEGPGASGTGAGGGGAGIDSAVNFLRSAAQHARGQAEDVATANHRLRAAMSGRWRMSRAGVCARLVYVGAVADVPCKCDVTLYNCR